MRRTDVNARQHIEFHPTLIMSSSYYADSSSVRPSPLVSALGAGVGSVDAGLGPQAASVPAILFAEMMAALFFVFMGGTALTVTGVLESENRSFLRIITVALVDGFVFYSLVYMVMKLTRGRSGYFNSALTASLCLVDLYLDSGHKMSMHIGRAVAHIVVQIIGSLLGAVLIVLLVPFALDGVEKTGIAAPALEGLGSAGAFMLDYIFSAFLVTLLLSVRNNENKKSSVLLMLAMSLCRLVLFPATGSTLNPSRALAHAIVGGVLKDVWIFIVAPILGAATATGAFIWMHRQDME